MSYKAKDILLKNLMLLKSYFEVIERQTMMNYLIKEFYLFYFFNNVL
jgi:hypothetical protein